MILQPLDMKIIYFNGGKKNNPEISQSDRNKISQILIKLFSNCDEVLKLYINDEKIKEIKKNDSEVEKVMIPFMGDFAGDEKSSDVTIFAGEKEYFTPALRNSNSYKNVMELEKIIRKASGHCHH